MEEVERGYKYSIWYCPKRRKYVVYGLLTEIECDTLEEARDVADGI